jgi:hypothetical protein
MKNEGNLAWTDRQQLWFIENVRDFKFGLAKAVIAAVALITTSTVVVAETSHQGGPVPQRSEAIALDCTDGETRPCPQQAGVCEDSQQTCSDGEWQACDAAGYQTLETLCDSKDNDCDGFADRVDLDGDGYNACLHPGVLNELLITGLQGDYSNITVFENRHGTYTEAWSISSSNDDFTRGGGEAGDLTGDGVAEIAIVRGRRLEVWAFDAPSQG